VFLDFCVVALYNLGFTICGSYIEQYWPPLICLVKVPRMRQPVTEFFQSESLYCWRVV